jgi:hypothetical protein
MNTLECIAAVAWFLRNWFSLSIHPNIDLFEYNIITIDVHLSIFDI